MLLLLALVAGHAFLDRSAPSSERDVASAAVVPITPRVSGEVTVVHVADDAVVEAGEPLFSIDPRPVELAVRQAEASLASALRGDRRLEHLARRDAGGRHACTRRAREGPGGQRCR